MNVKQADFVSTELVETPLEQVESFVNLFPYGYV